MKKFMEMFEMLIYEMRENDIYITGSESLINILGILFIGFLGL
jgi:hypothetical protein